MNSRKDFTNIPKLLSQFCRSKLTILWEIWDEFLIDSSHKPNYRQEKKFRYCNKELGKCSKLGPDEWPLAIYYTCFAHRNAFITHSHRLLCKFRRVWGTESPPRIAFIWIWIVFYCCDIVFTAQILSTLSFYLLSQLMLWTTSQYMGKKFAIHFDGWPLAKTHIALGSINLAWFKPNNGQSFIVTFHVDTQFSLHSQQHFKVKTDFLNGFSNNAQYIVNILISGDIYSWNGRQYPLDIVRLCRIWIYVGHKWGS